MKKIISLFKRDYESTRQVINEVVSGAEWVLAGEGVATEKIDGTCCMVKDGQLYKRYDAKKGKPPPDGWIAAQEPDEITGHWPGWLLVGDGPEDKWHREGWINLTNGFKDMPKDWTYELVGPKVQGNPYRHNQHFLIPHGLKTFTANPPRNFDKLRLWFEDHSIEGIVWHHSDGRMVKIKRRDFGFKWP